jgi:hypothetical protein
MKTYLVEFILHATVSCEIKAESAEEAEFLIRQNADVDFYDAQTTVVRDLEYDDVEVSEK